MWLKNKLRKQIEFFKLNSQFKIIYSNYFVKKNERLLLKFNENLESGYITQKLLKKYSVGILQQ